MKFNTHVHPGELAAGSHTSQSDGSAADVSPATPALLSTKVKTG